MRQIVMYLEGESELQSIGLWVSSSGLMYSNRGNGDFVISSYHRVSLERTSSSSSMAECIPEIQNDQTEREMKIEAVRKFDFELEDDDNEDFLSQVAAAEANALATKRRKITTDPPKNDVEEGLYIAALKGNPNVLSQISGGLANSRVKNESNGFHSSNLINVQSEGTGSCFKCGKLGHWSRDCNVSGNDSSMAEKPCPCGSGICSVLTANTEKNQGRKFYRCPVRQENGGCGFFEWCDNASGTNLMTYGSQNRAFGSSFPDVQCPCGAGSCLILTAKTGQNVGQQFYRCPANQASCGFFQWCKEPPIATKNQVSASKVYGNINDTNKSSALRTSSSTDTRESFAPRTASSCYKCGSEGHWARDCSQTSSNPPVEQGRSPSSSGVCYKCGKPGHWARDCSNC